MSQDRVDYSQELAKFFPQAEALRARLEAELTAESPNPLHNPVDALALNISDRLNREEYEDCDLENLVQYLVARAFLFRANRLGIYAGQTDIEQNKATMTTQIGSLSMGEFGKKGFKPRAKALRPRIIWA